jgi:addiction module antidote protein, HigA family
MSRITAALPPVHPGEVLREEFLLPMGLTAYGLAKAMRVPRTRIERLAREETAVTPDTALRLARVFGTSAEFWMALQTSFDLKSCAPTLADDLADITPLTAA